MKIGLPLLPEHVFLKNLHYFKFLGAESPIKNGMQEWTVNWCIQKTKCWPVPQAELYRANKTVIGDIAFPEFMLVIRAGTLVYQMFLRLSVRDLNEYQENQELQLFLFPNFHTEHIHLLKEIEIRHIDFSETNKISLKDKVVVYYGNKRQALKSEQQ